MNNNQKATKRALLTSVMALVMCVVMLVGTTFAWFTDTASTAVNKIVAGNLKVDIVDESGHTLVGAGKSLSFENANDNTDILWEPGATFHTEGFRIKNAGNLALKWKIAINEDSASTGVVEGGNGKQGMNLLDVIDFSVVSSKAKDAEAVKIDEFVGHTAANTVDSTTYYIKGTMQTTAGNDYQNLTLDGITITVYATQDTVEKDSFDDQYDKNAQYPDVAYVAVSAPTAEDIAAGVNPLANALISGSTETGVSGEAKGKIAADLAAGTFKLTDKEGSVRDAVKGMEVTLNGAGTDKTTYEVKKANATGEGAADYSFDGAKAVVFKNMTVEFGLNTDFQGFVRAGAVRFENCTIKGMGANWGVGDVVFDNCNFVFPEGGNEWTYNLWTYGGSSFTFNNCTFTSDIGRFINVYRQGNDGVVDVTLNGCEFINNAASANKAAVKINGDHAWNVTIKGCTTEGAFPTDNGGLWQIENAVAGNQITVDGTKAYSK
ncbi:MAG: SipW-dependent-type signal peptide-containing protein [Oscillospiraceae bacterium]